MVSPENGRLLLQLAKQALVNVLAGNRPDFPPLSTLPKDLGQPAAVFVTLRQGKVLRGCIGHLNPRRPLGHQVMETALASALEDPRFPALTQEDLTGLHMEISILTPFRRVKGAEEIRPGRNGVMVQKGNRSGLFLPQVWEETGWNKPTFLRELCEMKAGLDPSAWKDPDCELSIFEVEPIAANLSDIP